MSFKINASEIGPGNNAYIVAEMSANHGQCIDTAKKIIEAAKEAGADAVKIQTYTPDTLTIDCDNEYFMLGKGTIWEGKKLYDLYGEAFTPWEWQPELKEKADEIEIDFFSTPFDFSSVDFLEKMNVPAYKIASFELVDIPLLKKIASTGKPVIMSTGMANETEIKEAIEALGYPENKNIALLKCTSAYPAAPEEMNLKTIPYMADKFDLPIGLSDHTLENIVPVTAVSLGACVIEKHFTLSREYGGPDCKFSLEPREFKKMVKAVRTAEKALGKAALEKSENEEHSLIFRRSLFVVKDIKAGEKFDAENIRSIRPGNGMKPKFYYDVIGKTCAEDIKRGTPLSEKMIKRDSERK
jgi:pseudaminic acid synthase